MDNKVACMLLLLVTTVSNGAVITDLSERDWSNTGDGLLTYDSSTGLEWLDLTVTLGNSILDTEALSFYGSQFRWATHTEIDDLLDSVILGSGARQSFVASSVANVTQFINLLGGYLEINSAGTTFQMDRYYTQAVSRMAQVSPGMYGLGIAMLQRYPNYVLYRDMAYANDPSNYSCCWSEGGSNPRTGSWLVRTTNVPEPETFMLFIIGFGGLAFGRKGKNVKISPHPSYS